MDLHCDDKPSSLADQWWNDSMFDDSLQLSMATPESNTACAFLPCARSRFDVGSACDGGYGSQSDLEQELEDNLLFQSCGSPLALSPSVGSSTPPDFVADTGLLDSPPAPRRKRSHSPSADRPLARASNKIRRSSQTSSNSSSGSAESDDAPACVRRTSRPTTGGIRPALAPRKSASSKLSSTNSNTTTNIKSEAGEARPGPAGHSAVEKRYRDKINAQFDQLLSALPHVQTEERDGRSLSKGSILELAVQTVQSLEQENRALCWQVEQLQDAMRYRGYAGGQQRASTGMMAM